MGDKIVRTNLKFRLLGSTGQHVFPHLFLKHSRFAAHYSPSCICRVAVVRNRTNLVNAKKRDEGLNTTAADMDTVRMILCGAQLLLADCPPTHAQSDSAGCSGTDDALAPYALKELSQRSKRTRCRYPDEDLSEW